jgi:hypothetical protein
MPTPQADGVDVEVLLKPQRLALCNLKRHGPEHNPEFGITTSTRPKGRLHLFCERLCAPCRGDITGKSRDRDIGVELFDVLGDSFQFDGLARHDNDTAGAGFGVSGGNVLSDPGPCAHGAGHEG